MMGVKLVVLCGTFQGQNVRNIRIGLIYRAAAVQFGPAHSVQSSLLNTDKLIKRLIHFAIKLDASFIEAG